MTEKEVQGKIQEVIGGFLNTQSTNENLLAMGNKIRSLLHEFEENGCTFFIVDYFGYVNFGKTVRYDEVSVSVMSDKVFGKAKIEFTPRIFIACP